MPNSILPLAFSNFTLEDVGPDFDFRRVFPEHGQIETIPLSAVPDFCELLDLDVLSGRIVPRFEVMREYLGD